jgi:hypoxanthine-guanine phosphoribosyltransferase
VLVGQGELQKAGKGPHTKYKRIGDGMSEHITNAWDSLSYEMKQFLDREFLKFTPRGTRMTWYEGFIQWCQARDLDADTKASAYRSIAHHIDELRNECGLLDATDVFSHRLADVGIDELYYADQYKWMDFGRGKLAELTFYAKQSQNRKMIRESIEHFVHQITCLIQTDTIDALAFVPWSITREYQLLSMIDAALYKIDLPRINIQKFYEWETKVPQKSLKKRADRIENARETIYVRDEKVSNYHHVLLIDDFVGSGATLNETAKKLKAEGVEKVTGFAIVGNLDLSYDVIQEI